MRVLDDRQAEGLSGAQMAVNVATGFQTGCHPRTDMGPSQLIKQSFNPVP